MTLNECPFFVYLLCHSKNMMETHFTKVEGDFMEKMCLDAKA